MPKPKPDAAPPKAKRRAAATAPPELTGDAALTVDADLLAQGSLLAAHAGQIEQTLLELVTGIKITLPYKKKRLLRGESEWELTDEAGGTWLVYVQPPHPGLLKEAVQQTRGRASQRDAGSTKVGTLVLKVAVPGKDAEVTRYLASLTPEQLGKYQFDAETQAAIEASRLT